MRGLCGRRGRDNELGPEGGKAVAGALTALTGLEALDIGCVTSHVYGGILFCLIMLRHRAYSVAGTKHINCDIEIFS